MGTTNGTYNELKSSVSGTYWLKTEEREERTKDDGKSPRICLGKRHGRVTEVPRLEFSSRKRFFFSDFK